MWIGCYFQIEDSPLSWHHAQKFWYHRFFRQRWPSVPYGVFCGSALLLLDQLLKMLCVMFFIWLRLCNKSFGKSTFRNGETQTHLWIMHWLCYGALVTHRTVAVSSLRTADSQMFNCNTQDGRYFHKGWYHLNFHSAIRLIPIEQLFCPFPFQLMSQLNPGLPGFDFRIRTKFYWFIAIS